MNKIEINSIVQAFPLISYITHIESLYILVKCVLLDKSYNKMNQIHRTESVKEAGNFAS